MREVLRESLNVLFVLLGRPGSMAEFYTVLGVGLLVMVLVLSKTAEATGARRYEFGWSLVVALTGSIAGIAAWSSARVLLARIVPAQYAPYSVPAATAAVLLLVVFPVTMGVFRCTLTGAIMSWAVSLAAVAAATLLVGVAFDLWGGMQRDARAAGVHKQTIEEFTDLLGP